MKLNESGMPEEAMWKGFFRPNKILKRMGLNREVNDVADFGCGYGTFSIPAARLISGTVYAIDIELEMVETTKRKARENKLNNIEVILRDFMIDGSGIRDKRVDYVMLFNILYTNGCPEKLLREANRILRNDGKVGIIHWNYDPATPRGPPMDIRPKPEQIIDWLRNSGFNHFVKYELLPYHYGILAEKENKR